MIKSPGKFFSKIIIKGREREARVLAVIILADALAYICFSLFVFPYVEIEGLNISSRFLELMAIADMLALMLTGCLKFSEMGLKIRPGTGRRMFLRAILIAAGICGLMYAARFILQATAFPQLSEQPVFGLYINIPHRLLYPLTAVVQEFCVKGIVQNMFEKILVCPKRDKKRITVLIVTGVVFFLLHLGYNPLYALGAGLFCFLTGFIYRMDGSIWGCAIIHFAIGFLPRCVGIRGLIG